MTWELVTFNMFNHAVTLTASLGGCIALGAIVVIAATLTIMAKMRLI